MHDVPAHGARVAGGPPSPNPGPGGNFRLELTATRSAEHGGPGGGAWVRGLQDPNQEGGRQPKDVATIDGDRKVREPTPGPV